MDYFCTQPFDVAMEVLELVKDAVKLRAQREGPIKKSPAKKPATRRIEFKPEPGVTEQTLEN